MGQDSEGEKEAGKRKNERIGAWNVRLLGSKGEETGQYWKWRCVRALWTKRGWKAALLSDVQGAGKTADTTGSGRDKWTVMYHTKVAIALDEEWTARWRKGGCKMEKSPDGRSMALDIPPQGWQKGFRLIAAYAPTSKQNVGIAQRMRNGVEKLVNNTPREAAVVAGGDWNAQVGAGKDDLWRTVLGPHGDARRTERGEALLAMCETLGMQVANTYSPQKNKYTWRHWRWGTDHAIDHFLVKRADMRRVNQTITLHKEVAGTEGLEHWAPYTDHNPIELTMRVGRDWAQEEERRQRKGIKKADLKKIRGQTKEASEWKRKMQEEIAHQIRTAKKKAREDLTWKEISDIVKGSAYTVLGEAPEREGEPWRRGREEQYKSLGEVVTAAREWHNELRKRKREGEERLDEKIGRANKMKKDAEKLRRDTEKQWENQWWEKLAEEAEEAEKTGDAVGAAKMLKEIGGRGEKKRDKGTRETVLDPEKEREAWKDHFAQITAEAGRVHPRVWNNVAKTDKKEKWMGEEPTEEEINEAITKMKIGKAGGYDEVTAEHIKYGGRELREEVHRIVKNMWTKAAYAEEGAETEGWPSKWTIAMQVRLWKNKGDKADKNTWRGITLLSVGTKILARIVADRVQRWLTPWRREDQNGFTPGRGTDDAHQLTRRLI